MKKTRNKLIFSLALFWGSVTLLISYLLENALVQYKSSFYLLIPLYFLLFGVVLVFSLSSVSESKQEDKKRVNKYMLLKTTKILVSLGFVVVYWLINRTEIRNFALVFIVFYMIFLLFETYASLQIEKAIKKEF